MEPPPPKKTNFILGRLGIILESAPAAIFCIVTEAKGQLCVPWSCFFTSTEARWLIRDGDGGEEDERVKARPRIRPKKTVDRRQNNGSVKAVSPRHCAATSALRKCCFNCRAGQRHTDNVRCTAVEEQTEAKVVQLSQPSSTSLLKISSGLT